MRASRLPGRRQAEDRLLVFSADGHAGGRLEDYRPYLEQKYHRDLDDLVLENETYVRMNSALTAYTPESLEVVDGAGRIAGGGVAGAWEVDRRLAELDVEGIAGEVILGGHQAATLPFFSVVNKPRSPELRAAGARAYHRWLADCLAAGNGRLFGVGDPGPVVDMHETVRELEWLAEHGFVSVGVPGIVADDLLPPLVDPYYEPFWAACAGLGLRLSVHAGWGHPQGAAFAFFEQVAQLGELDMQKQIALAEKLRDAEGSPFILDIGPRRVAWQLMLSGAFDRHPDLQLILTEVRADWVPGTLAVLDQLLPNTAPGLTRLPSEYFAQQCWLVPSSPHRAEVELRHEIGLERIMFGSDYPHIEGTWPNTLDWIKAAFHGIPAVEARQILGENALRCYGLDAAPLRAVAARIGPRPDEVLLEHSDVDEALLAAFHKRGGFQRPAETVNLDVVSQAVAADVEAVAALTLADR